MSRLITPGDPAPDFELDDVQGQRIRLSQFRGGPVVLDFLRGFMWPYCRAQLARLRDEYQKFAERGAVILAIGPNAPEEFQRFWENENIPFIGLPDPEHKIARLYKQEVNLFKLGRMPLNCVVDAAGQIRYAHYGNSMSNIPANETLLDVIDKLNAASV